MSSDQGWFESDEDYSKRVAQEANERTIESTSGTAPSQGWFESDNDYRERVQKEANECRVECATGSSPSQGWLESDDDYRDRIEREANEATVETLGGSAPTQGWFESDDDYRVRIRREANEQILEMGNGSAPKQGWFESDHDYRSRIAHEAREFRRNAQTNPRSAASESEIDAGSDGGSGIGVSSPFQAGGLGIVGSISLVIVCFAIWLDLDRPTIPSGALSATPKVVPSLADTLHIDPVHRQMVYRWLQRTPSFGVPAQSADCSECGDGRLPTGWGWDNQHPFYSLGDFNRDGHNDLAIVSKHGDLAVFPGPLDDTVNAFFVGNIVCDQTTDFGQCSIENHGSYIYYSSERNQFLCGGYATETACSVRAMDQEWVFYSGRKEEWKRVEVVAPAGRWSDRLILDGRPLVCEELPEGILLQGDDETKTVRSRGNWSDLGPDYLKTIRFKSTGEHEVRGVCRIQYGRVAKTG